MATATTKKVKGRQRKGKTAGRRAVIRRAVATARQVEREIGPLPPVANPARREACAHDARLYCRTYFPYLFTYDFNPDQAAYLDAIVSGIFEGGWRAEAAPRGEGKTTIAKGVLTWAVNYGYIGYGVFLGANATLAQSALADVRAMYEQSEILIADFPEICYPVARLQGATQRGRMQILDGRRTHLLWGTDEIVMPMVPGSPSGGAILNAKGIDGAIRGLIYHGRRPDFVLIDDPETRASAYSTTETTKRVATIEQDLAGLAGQTRQVSMVLLCTIIRRGCLADQFTDRTEKPAWHGHRRKLLKQPPTHDDLWAQYIEHRQTDQLAGEGTGRTAHKFYVDNRAAMDAGAEVANPHRYDPEFEASALEAIYNRIADGGWDNFASEYQNEPPDESGPETSGINIRTVCNKINHMGRGMVPSWCERLTAFIDVGGRLLHWVVVAWRQGMSGYVIDCGTEQVHSPTGSLRAGENQHGLFVAHG